MAQGGQDHWAGAVDGEDAVNNETSNPAQLQSQRRHDRWFLGIHKGFDVLKHTITWCGIGGVLYYANEMISSLAGRTTLADIWVGVLVSVQQREWVAYVIAAMALIWGWRERRLRMQKVEYFGNRVVHLESQLDPNRSFSHLTPKGETRPEDR